MSKVRNAVAGAVVAGVTAAVADPATAAKASDRPVITEAVLREIEPVIQHVANAEPWYLSRVTWGAILAGVAGVLAVFGKADLLPPELQGKIIEGIIAAGPLIGAGLALYGRYVAKKPIGR